MVSVGDISMSKKWEVVNIIVVVLDLKEIFIVMGIVGSNFVVFRIIVLGLIFSKGLFKVMEL